MRLLRSSKKRWIANYAKNARNDGLMGRNCFAPRACFAIAANAHTNDREIIYEMTCRAPLQPHPICDHSCQFVTEIFKELNVKADMAYVDGSHDALDVYYDCLNYFELIKEGGCIMGDDLSWDSVREGVYTFADQENLKVEILPGNIAWKINKK